MGVKSEKIDKLRYLMMHPIRYRIVKEIEKSGKSYAAKIAKNLGLERKLISYHLLTLLQHNIVTAHYGLRGEPPTDEHERPVIVRYYKLTKEAKKILSSF